MAPFFRLHTPVRAAALEGKTDIRSDDASYRVLNGHIYKAPHKGIFDPERSSEAVGVGQGSNYPFVRGDIYRDPNSVRAWR